MSNIPSESRDLLEQAIYYPMLVKVLERDLIAVDKSPFKLPKPYKDWIEQTLIFVQKQLFSIKRELKRQGMKIHEVKRDELFTTYLFVYRGYEEYHSYFNPSIRNKVEELLAYHLYKRFDPE
ncbi:hypothetical protein [Fervidibacillus halotolerans]|uniref:YhjD n=1 Tax=Fervidibacillus halotolerans TaxID=2980027 RepID=A0A9E8M248_9BACI|nr:hypothetical protein [Fervidibacillus halotolerans]WAA13031.1 hypothetical protein OE105_02575 [Fervidibacillus halotolerans]